MSKRTPITDPMLKTDGLRQHALMIYGVENGSLMCEMQSSTEARYYKMAVRLSDGALACQCPYFQFRCKQVKPTLYSGMTCRHFSVFREYLQKEVAIQKNEVTRKEIQEESETLEGEALVAATESIFSQ